MRFAMGADMLGPNARRWALVVLAFQWVLEPFGPFMTEREWRKLYAVMFGVPAVVLTFYVFRRMQDRDG